MTQSIRISLEDLKPHLEHTIRIDHGKGKASKYEYSIWCNDCQDTIGNSLEVKG